MKCRIGQRTGNFVVGDSLGAALDPESTSRRDTKGGIEMSFFVTEDAAMPVQRRDEA
jgi:hypothetical protein